jgi:hypothetical protein
MTNTRFNPMYFTAMLPLSVLVHIIFKQKTPLTLEATNDELNVTKVYLGIMVLVTIYYYKYY